MGGQLPVFVNHPIYDLVHGNAVDLPRYGQRECRVGGIGSIRQPQIRKIHRKGDVWALAGHLSPCREFEAAKNFSLFGLDAVYLCENIGQGNGGELECGFGGNGTRLYNDLNGRPVGIALGFENAATVEKADAAVAEELAAYRDGIARAVLIDKHSRKKVVHASLD